MTAYHRAGSTSGGTECYTWRMYEVRVETSFSAAHFLRDYHGKCEHLHGHNYKVYAHARGTKLDEGGMLLDFSVFKKALRKVCESLDHTNLNDITEFQQNPSAERIAAYIARALIEEIPQLGQHGGGTAALYAVDVFETDTSRARWIAPET